MQPLIGIFIFIMGAAASSLPPVRTEYGKPTDLRSLKSVYVWAGEDEALRDEARRQLHAALPALEISEREDGAGVDFFIERKEVEDVPGGAKSFLTKARATRARGRIIQLYVDASSKANDVPTAVAEVVTPFVTLLQQANPRRFAKQQSEDESTRRIHSAAGLRPGLEKEDVLSSIGPPSRVDKQTNFTETWTYPTVQGYMRVIFGAGRVVAIQLYDKHWKPLPTK